MSPPLANILHRDAMRRLVDERTFERGQKYFSGRRVHGLTPKQRGLSAEVRGTSPYHVRIWVKDEALAYSCTCPVGADGLFCKHAVAVGLAWLAHRGEPTRTKGDDLEVELARFDKRELLELVLEEARDNEAFRQRLERKILSR